MGIPSYFKHLFDRYAGLLTKAGTVKADVLLVDFNCLIYGCIRGPKMPTYTHATREAWEAAAYESIGEYVVKLWNVAGKPSRVLLAVDGVVPMAKIKQQRMRRFKSVWLAAKERELGVRAPGQEMWDTNAITPGTEFMEKLGKYLGNLCTARGPGWLISGADEEGEGEQKIMDWVRRSAGELANKRIFVYGLDADLIVLCLLHAGVLVKTQETTWHILRERQEFNVKAAATMSTEVEFLLLSVQALLGALPEDTTANLLDYVAGMSLLGNDFLPHSLSVSIRDGGHDRLLAALRDIHAKGLTLVIKRDGLYRISADALKHIVGAWAQTLDEDTVRAFERKYKARGPPPRNESERAMIGVQNLPLEWAAENRLWLKEGSLLHTDWRSRYYEDAANQVDIAKRCETYCVGLQWILDYYTGQRPVNMAWLYPWSGAPLWSDLEQYLASVTELPDAPVFDKSVSPLRPQEQLAIVLPSESWSLVRDPQLKGLPQRLPSFWPTKFGFESLGKRWLWECEPQIPLLIPARIRA